MIGYICCSNCCKASTDLNLCNGCMLEIILQMKKERNGLMHFYYLKSYLVRF